MNCEDRCRTEVDELHRFFQEWFSGVVPNTEESLARFRNVLADEFQIISPAGLALEKSPILDTVRSGYGREPDAKIWIENHRHRMTIGGLSVVTYEEWQESTDGKRGRLSTALLQASENTPNDVQWLHVHETWLPE